MRLKPLGHIIEIEGYDPYTESGGYGSDLPIFKFWEDIREGKRNPDGVAMIIYNAFQKTLFSDEERRMKSIPDIKYPLSVGETAVPTAMMKRVIDPMYAKLEVFELNLLPINELEMAMSYLDTFKQLGYIKRSTFCSYALHLAQSMEKFGVYLWKLEKWGKKLQKRTDQSSNTTHDKIRKEYFLALAPAYLAGSYYLMQASSKGTTLLSSTLSFGKYIDSAFSVFFLVWALFLCYLTYGKIRESCKSTLYKWVTGFGSLTLIFFIYDWVNNLVGIIQSDIGRWYFLLLYIVGIIVVAALVVYPYTGLLLKLRNRIKPS